jgi:hypothetical protein
MHVFETNRRRQRNGDATQGTRNMPKKQSKKSPSKNPQVKAHAKASSRSGAVNKPATAKRARSPVTAIAPAPSATGRRPTDNAEARLPPLGTVIRKLDRYGAVRCECVVEEAGIRYNGNLYRSLSGAAMAAAKDLGLTNKTQNGFTFWGLTKPRRPGGPLESLTHAWERYQKHLTTLVSDGLTDENRAQAATLIDQHASALQALRGQVSANQAPVAP